MGIKTSLTLDELQEHIPCTWVIPTAHGVSDTVYRTDAGVVKIFESASVEAVCSERELLNDLRTLPVAQPLKIFTLGSKPAALYETLPGASLEQAAPSHILQISRFLRNFHDLSRGRQSSNTNLFDPLRLEALIKQSGSNELGELFFPLPLNNDGVIHGDLFLDNALFEEGRLSGVIDFIEACEGDFHFDLAVVAISWCLPSLENVALLLEGYGSEMSLETFLPYMRYALLYYATTRYVNGRDYRSLLDQITLLSKETP